MTEPLLGKSQQVPYQPHENYDYEHHEVGDHDHFTFKRGNEAIEISLAHPHVERLNESDPKWNEEHQYQGSDKYTYQHTLWDKPYGRSNKAEITRLFATPGAKADVGAALGVVMNHSMKRFGHVPEASNSLSVHSVPVVSRLMAAAKEKGVSDIKNTWSPSYATNDIVDKSGEGTKELVDRTFKSDYYKDIPQEHITSGSKLMRGLFAGRHLNRQQFTQQELPQQ